MKENMASFKSKLTSSWSNFSPMVKWTIIGSFLATFLIILAFVFFSNKTEYGTLYSGLEASEAGEIKAAIDEQGIPVKVSSDSTTISVPKENISDLKVNLAAEGIPKSGNVDYGIFSENMGLGMTDRHFDVVERDAMQNELASLIKQIDGVTEASVMITLPKENIWITDEEQVATASVVIKGAPSFQLDPKQVNGLHHLISKSVPSLPAEEIVIMDQNGQVFEVQEENKLDTSLSIYQQQREIKKDIEKDIQRELQQMLGLTLGQDKVVVSVMTSIDFTKENREEKLVEPVNKETNEGIDISVERIVETYSSEGATVEDATGTGESEIANYPAAGEGGKTDSEKTEERINREVNRINRQIEMSPYVIDDITINVGVEPPNPQNPASLTQQNMDDISNLLKNTVSTSLSMSGQVVTEEDLDNRISVFATEFQGKPQVVAEKEKVQVSWLDTLIGNPLMLAIAGAVVLLIGLIVVLVVRRKRQQEDDDFDIFDQPFVEAEELKEDEFDLSEFDAAESPKRKTIEKLAKGRPDDFAKLLRTWMAEE